MERRRLVKILSEYEKNNPIETFISNGINVWPIIRVALSFEILKKNNCLNTIKVNKKLCYDSNKYSQYDYGFKTKSNNIKKKLKNYIIKNIKQRKIAYYALKRNEHLPFQKSDVVFVTYPSRLISFNEKYYNTVVDPLIEILSKKKIKFVIWERSNKLQKRLYKPADISNYLKIENDYLIKDPNKSLITTRWFKDVKKWVDHNFNIQFNWDQLSNSIIKVVVNSAVMKKWLKKSQCKVLVIDSWYDQDSMSASIAASELRIRTIDYQHGQMGEGHFAYDSWYNAPAGGYEMKPNNYWVWGQDDVDMLISSNPNYLFKKNIFSGGNLWLNKFRAPQHSRKYYRIDEAKDIAKNSTLKILVTLQKGINLDQILIEAIENSPKEWFWFIRLHRKDFDKIDHYSKKFKSIRGKRINVDKATEIPLYILLKVVDTHVTGYSTCALEALAFGVPTILIHSIGKKINKKYLRRGVMRYSENSVSLIKNLIALKNIDKHLCVQSVDDAFAPIENANKAIDWLLGLT